ncbi:MAG: hypothetical protein NTW75_04645 [Planctomycetales bacterium]|nr:hypothetical protein [Planctomycetales bacterium]
MRNDFIRWAGEKGETWQADAVEGVVTEIQAGSDYAPSRYGRDQIGRTGRTPIPFHNRTEPVERIRQRLVTRPFYTVLSDLMRNQPL